MDSKIGKNIGAYLVEKQLGKGQFGVVYLAKSTRDNNLYAIKCINKADIDKVPKLKSLLHAEVGVMHKIDHPNVMHLYEFLESSNNYYMVIQYCNGGDMEAYLKKKPGNFIPEMEALFYLKQIMNAFNVLHAEKIMHRDFKLANIFMHNDIIVIGDFGFAKAGFDMAKTLLGTPVMMAPELHLGQNSYNSKADLWSIGVVFYEMLYGDNPYFGLNINEIITKIRANSGANLRFRDDINKVSDLSKDLLRRILEMDPDKRIDWEGFFNHPVFSQTNIYVPNPNIEKEFQENRHNIGHEEKIQNFQDPLTLGINKAPQIIPESNPSPGQRQIVELDMALKENQFRYLHEKNKIMLIFLTVKKLRQLMKDPDYYELSKYIYLLMMILGKKGLMLSELTIYSLNVKNNIFKLNIFEQFCQGSREYSDVSAFLREDQPKITAYYNYMLGLKNEVNLMVEDEKTLDWLNGPFIDLKQLDEKAYIVYRQIQELSKPVKLTFNPEENRRYLLAMYLSLHSIRSETLLPYTEHGRKLEWQTFKVRVESMNPEMLKQSLFSMDR